MPQDELERLIVGALAPALRRFVRSEMREAEWVWRWRTPEEAGELLGISASAVRRRVAAGELPASRLQGRIYIDILDLDGVLQRGRKNDGRTG